MLAGYTSRQIETGDIETVKRRADPNRREGGIIANDEQWRARMQRIND